LYNGYGSFPGVESGRGVTLTPHPLLVPRSKNRVELIPLLSLRAFVAYEKVETYLRMITLTGKFLGQIPKLASFECVFMGWPIVLATENRKI
jgi:hypothetical protein